MTLAAQASGSDSTCRAHEQEARLLVELLRTSRLSVLYAEADTDKSAFLASELVPLLCRRAVDQVGPAKVRASGVVVPLPDRRNHSNPSSKRRREVAVHVADWSDTPLETLREALYLAVAAHPADAATRSACLSDVLQDLGQRFDVNFIVLLDGFETLFRDPASRAAVDQFLDEFAEAINRATLSANFLIAVAQEARPRLASLRLRIRGFDNFSLKLAPRRTLTEETAPLRLHEPTVPAILEALPVLTQTLIVSDGGSTQPTTHRLGVLPPKSLGKVKPKRVPPPPVLVKTEDVYAMIERALSRIAGSTAVGRAQPPGRPSRAQPRDEAT